jgi:DNA polymerase type B, organellar and viral
MSASNTKTLLLLDSSGLLYHRFIIRLNRPAKLIDFATEWNGRARRFYMRIIRGKYVFYFNAFEIKKTSWGIGFIELNQATFLRTYQHVMSKHKKKLRYLHSCIIVLKKKLAFSARIVNNVDWSKIAPKTTLLSTCQLMDIFKYQGVVYDKVFFARCKEEYLSLSVPIKARKIDDDSMKRKSMQHQFIYGAFDLETYGGKFDGVELLPKSRIQPTMMSFTLFTLDSTNQDVQDYLDRFFEFCFEKLLILQNKKILYYTHSIELLKEDDCNEAKAYAKHSFSVHSWDGVMSLSQKLLEIVMDVIVDAIIEVYSFAFEFTFVIAGWNSGRFDSILSFWALQSKIFACSESLARTNTIMSKPSRLLNYSLTVGKHNLIFRDLMMVIPTVDGGKSLSNLCETLKIKCAKTDIYKGNVAQLFADQLFVIKNINNTDMHQQVWNKIKILEYYCAFDVFAVCDLYKWFFRFFQVAFQSFGVAFKEANIVECFSLPQIALKTLWSIIGKKIALIEVAISTETDWFLRQAIYGPRCLTNSYGSSFVNTLRCRRMSDFKSMYPSCFLNPFPVGKLQYVRDYSFIQSQFNEGTFYFMNHAPFVAHTRIRKIKPSGWFHEYPLAPQRSATDGLVWHSFGNNDHHFASCVDLYLLMKDGWEITIHEMIRWDKWERIYREAFLTFFERRKIAADQKTEEGDMIAYFNKIMMNVTFGKTIQKPSSSAVKIDLQNKHIVHATPDEQFIPVQIGMFVLSYSRLLWYMFVDWSLTKLQYPSGKVPRLLYTDTDSFLMEYYCEEDADYHFDTSRHTNSTAAIYSHLSDIIAENLELQEKFGIVFEKKCEKNCPNNSFNIQRIHIVGKKLYCMACDACGKKVIKGKGLNLSELDETSFLEMIANPEKAIVNVRPGCLKVSTFDRLAQIQCSDNSMIISGYDLVRKVVMKHPKYQSVFKENYYGEEILVYKCMGRVINEFTHLINNSQFVTSQLSTSCGTTEAGAVTTALPSNAPPSCSISAEQFEEEEEEEREVFDFELQDSC